MGTEWMTVKEAARLYNSTIGACEIALIRQATPVTVRRHCREGQLVAAGVRVEKLDNGYIINRIDFLSRIYDIALGAAARAALEMGWSREERIAWLRKRIEQIERGEV